MAAAVSVVFAEKRRISPPIGKDSATIPSANHDASDPICVLVKPRMSRWCAMSAIEIP